MKRETFNTLLALAILAITTIPVGVAVFVFGFMSGDSPCVLCWGQRIGMLVIALIGTFMLRYGPRPRYLGLLILVAAFGVYMGLRQSSLHLVRDVGQGFSLEVLGAHTYTWSLFIYWCTILTAGGALLFLRDGELTGSLAPLTPLGKVTQWVFLIVVGANAFQAFTSTGPPPFMGQSDPVRYSFNPGNWVWSLEEWEARPISMRGRWAIEKPCLESLDRDPGRGPLANVEVLQAKSREPIALQIKGKVTDIAYDDTTDAFLLTTTQDGIYLTDGEMKNVLRHTRIDTAYSVDLTGLNGAAFLDSKTIMALSINKSYVILRMSDKADAQKNYRYFLESLDKFEELERSRFSTVRAKMMYVMCLAYDPASNSCYTVTVPNSTSRKLVVSRFNREDMTLSEEWCPKLGEGLALRGQERSLGEYYVTGIAIKDRFMYAISAAYNTLLVIDLRKREIDAAYAVSDLVKPWGVAIRGRDLCFVDEGSTLLVTQAPNKP